MNLKKCTKCGGDNFYIQEIIFHEAAICPENGMLNVYGDHGSGIERIFCKDCEADYSEKDFKQINFR